MARLDLSRIKTHSIRGKLFRIVWRKPRDEKTRTVDGQCEDVRFPGPTRIYVGIRHHGPMGIFITVLHECVHAAFPDLDEKAVEDFVTDFIRLVRRMGIHIEFKRPPKT